ncbi:MAG: LacI family DNA-binding transcriptional regulator [Lactovum sp.]
MIVTIDDVAQQAGVNKSTVSRALNGSKTISEVTRKKIQKIADDMGYVGNLHAKMLASQQVNAIGVVFPAIADQSNQPFFMKILTAINESARENLVTVAIATGRSVEELESQVRRMHLERRVDGFIVLYAENDSVRSYLETQKIPFVLVGSPEKEGKNINSVDNDNYMMGVEAAQYLLSRGHKKLLFFIDEIRGNFSKERLQGFLDSVGKNTCQVVNIYNTNFVRTDETAAVMLDDWIAVSLIERLKNQKVQIPDDLSIISFNNSYLSELIQPRLTTYGINVRQLGEKAVAVLQHTIKTGEKQQVLVPFHLVERDSVKTI